MTNYTKFDDNCTRIQASLMGSDGKESACNAGDLGSISGLGRPLGKEMATHSSILAWKIPCTKETGIYIPWGHEESDTTEQLTLYTF